MKKNLFSLTIIAFVLILSCGTDKKATNFKELKAKYDGVEFKSCDEFIEFGDEYLGIVVAVIYEAIDGVESAFEKIEDIDSFMLQFNPQVDRLQEKCPEKFEEFNIKAEEKLKEPMDKLMKYLFEEMNMINDSEIEEELYRDQEEYEIQDGV